MQTGSNIEFYNETRTSFRAASTTKNSSIGVYTATSIVYNDIFGEPASATVEFECPTSWALGCLPQKDNVDVSQRARYVSITMPDGLRKTFLVDEADIQELDSEQSSVSIKAYSPEYWLRIVPSTIKNANSKFTTTQRYSDILKAALNMYSIGYEEEKIDSVSFRDIPILAYDSDYEPTADEKLYYGVIKHDIATSPVDEKPAAMIASTDTIPSYPEPQGSKISDIMKEFPYLLSTSGTTQEVEYRQDFDMVLIPANSPYNDGCLWWRWAMRPKTSSAMYFSRANGTITENSKMHISSKSSTLVYLPDDETGNSRKNVASIGGSIYTGVWNSVSAQQAEASGISGSDMTDADATKIAAADAAALSPITVDITANGDSIHEMIRPGMQAFVRYGDQTIKFTIGEVDYGFDADSGWSINVPLTIRKNSISYIYTPTPTKNDDENLLNNPDVESPTIDNTNIPAGYDPSIPGISNDHTSDIPDTLAVDPYIPDDIHNSDNNKNPVKIIISESMGDNAARAGFIHTVDGRWYAIYTNKIATMETSYMKPVVKKLDGIPADAKFASAWSISAGQQNKSSDNYDFVSTAFMVSSSGKTMYKAKITNDDVAITQGLLPGKFISMYSEDRNLNSAFWVITSIGKYKITDSLFGGLDFVNPNKRSRNDFQNDNWIRGIKSVITNGEQYYMLAENGFFKYDYNERFSANANCIMPAPKRSHPIGIISPSAVVYSTGVYKILVDSEAATGKKIKGIFDGNIIGFSPTVNSGISDNAIIWTKYSVYICNKDFDVYKVFSTNKETTIKNVYVSPAGNMVNYPDNLCICIVYEDGGYTTVYGSDKTWTQCKNFRGEKITALTGFSINRITNTKPLTADDNMLEYTGVMYATNTGIYAPSLSGDSKLQAALPNNGIVKVAGEKPFFDGIVLSGTTANLVEEYVGGRSIWISNNGKTWIIDTSAESGENIAAADINEISSKTGLATNVVENDGEFIILSDRGIMDEMGARKDAGITITNPSVVRDSYSGGFYVSSDEDGLWKILPGMQGISGAQNTMIRQVPTNGKITYVNQYFASGAEEAWLGERATLYPILDIKDGSLINDPIWIAPTMGIVEFNEDKNPYPAGKGNVGIIQKKLRRAPLKQKYNHIENICGDPKCWFANRQYPGNMNGWGGAAILWDDTGKYAFIGTKLVQDKPLNLYQEYTLPAGEVVAGVVYGYGILSASGKMYLLDSAGSMTNSIITLGNGVKATWRVAGEDIQNGGQIVLGTDNKWYQIMYSGGTYILGSIKDMGGTNIRSFAWYGGTSAYVAADDGIYQYDGANSVASKIISDDTIKALTAPEKIHEKESSDQKIIGVLKGDGFYELEKDDLGLHKYDEITGSVYDVIWNDYDSILISTNDGVWVMAGDTAPYKIQDLTLKTGVMYPFRNGKIYGISDINVFSQAVKSTGETGIIATATNGSYKGAVWTDNGYKINGVSSIHYGADSGQVNYFGDESYGYMPSKNFKAAPWLVSDAPHVQYIIHHKYADDIYTGGMYGKYGAFMDNFFMLHGSEYGSIEQIWFGGNNITALILTKNALLSVNSMSRNPIVVKLMDRKSSDDIKFIGRNDGSISGGSLFAPYIMINGTLKYVDSELYTGTTDRYMYTLKDITNLTGEVLYANPAKINYDASSTGFVITNTGFWSITNAIAKKITGVYTNNDGTSSTRQLEPLTKKPSVAIGQLTLLFGTNPSGERFDGSIIISRAEQDGGGAMIMALKGDGTLFSVLEISELSHMGAVSTDAMYGESHNNKSYDNNSILDNSGSALAQVGEHVYAIAPKNDNKYLSYVIEDITKKISDVASDIMVSL